MRPHAVFALSSMKVSRISHQRVMCNAKVRGGYSCNNSHEAKRDPWNSNIFPRVPSTAAHCAHASQPHRPQQLPAHGTTRASQLQTRRSVKRHCFLNDQHLVPDFLMPWFRTLSYYCNIRVSLQTETHFTAIPRIRVC